ncbi:MAG: carboxypeptidase-like regulatory domain-containing protein, partial [Planctomycetota bacterium]
MTRPLNPSKLAVDRTTIADGYGRFRFEEIPLEPASQQDMPVYMIWTQLGDQAAAVRFLGDQITRERYLELVLANVGPLAGIVTDMAGKPVEEASVSIRAGMISEDYDKRFSVPALRTGPDGRFGFRYLLPGQYKLSVDAKGFLQQTTFWLRTGTQDIVVRLDRGLAISGRVTDAATGKPFTGCYVGALPKRGAGSNAEIDSSGQFTVSGLLPEVYSLRLASENDSTGFGGSGERCPYCLANPVVVDLTKGKPVTGLELKAITGGAINGQVLDAATGDPVGEAGVQALDAGNQPVGGTQCDESGKFRIEGLAAGKYTLKSEHKNYEEKLAPVEVEAGQVREGVVIRLSHPPGITGRVIDAEGNPVAGAAVSAVSTEDAYRQVSGVSDKSGAFGLYFKFDPPSYTQAPRQVYVQALHESGMSPRVGPVDVRDPGGEIILEIASTGRIEGEVLDQNGAPVSRADVAAVPEEKSAANIMSDYLEYGQCSDHIQDEAQTRTSFSGSFSFDSLLPGTYELQVYLAASPMTLPVAKTTVFVRAGQVLHARLVVDTSPFGTIEGSVTMNGKPFPGQMVWAFMKSVRRGLTRGQTDEEGLYRLDCVLPGEVTVMLIWQPLMEGTSGRVIREQSVEVTAGQVSTADFDVPVASTFVEGVVTTNGFPEDGALLQFTQGEPSQEQANVATDSQGYYRIALPEGAYGVNVYRFRTPINLTAMQYTTVQALA